jgi:MFS family permease
MVYYRRNLLVLSLTSFLAACGLNQIVPLLPLFIKELGVKGGVAFWAGVTLAAQTVAMIVMLPYWGKLGGLPRFDVGLRDHGGGGGAAHCAVG